MRKISIFFGVHFDLGFGLSSVLEKGKKPHLQEISFLKNMNQYNKNYVTTDKTIKILTYFFDWVHFTTPQSPEFGS